MKPSVSALMDENVYESPLTRASRGLSLKGRGNSDPLSLEGEG